jgi:signal transduction histidine kinase
VQILDGDGVPLDIPLNEQTHSFELSEEGILQLKYGRSWTEIATGEDGRYLVYHVPIQDEGQTVLIVQMARSLADRDRSLQALALALIVGSLLTTAVAFGVGWVLSGLTLRPIQRITQTAQRIGQERNFSSRVKYQGPNDELGRLAATFNHMLAGLQDAYQHVAHALQVQRDFVADVSHELRTPLTTVRGNLALLGHDDPRMPLEEREDILNDMVDETDRLIRLVGDLLTLARADAGRKLNEEPVDVMALVQETCRQTQVLVPERDIDCQGPDGVLALADQDALKQVMLILLDNAVNHTDGPVEVTCGVDKDRVTVRVRDTGPGMPPELCERVFDRFYRGDASRTTPGFGLGLSIAKSLVEAQQGTIQVESEIGTGSTFIVTLPLFQDAEG